MDALPHCPEAGFGSTDIIRLRSRLDRHFLLLLVAATSLLTGFVAGVGFAVLTFIAEH